MWLRVCFLGRRTSRFREKVFYGGQKLFRGIRLRQKFITLDEHSLHAIGEALSSRVNDRQIRFSLDGFFRQHHSSLNVRLKAEICEQQFNPIIPIKER